MSESQPPTPPSKENPPRDTSSPYELLGFGPEVVGASLSPEELKDAYRKLSKTHHPDLGGNAEAFKNLTEAYAKLSDPDTRREIDLELEAKRHISDNIDSIMDDDAPARPARRVAPRARASGETTTQQRRTYSVAIENGKEYLLKNETGEKLGEGYKQITDRGRFLVGVAESRRTPMEYLLDPKSGERLAGPYTQIRRNEQGDVIGTSQGRTGTSEEKLDVPEWTKN
ncbi:MAG: Chaperone protein DnaJ [Parcubacteria bacterium C7867-001]|nr:MAG: Chaperone protein DnaJ [Parcubacteria bacterium C7867-001]